MAGVPIWEATFGEGEGRIVPANWTPTEGTFAFVLGSDIPGLTGKLKTGDNIQISQSGNYPAGSFHFAARTRGPSSVPDQCWWEAAFLVGGTVALVRRIDADELLDFADMGWEVTNGAAGALAFTLTLQGPANLVVEPELPAFYLDAITFAAPDGTKSIRLYNRFPEPGSSGVRADRPISFDLFPSSVDPSTVTVTVNGATAFTAGAFTAPFDGSQSAQTTTAAGSLRWTIDPLAIWPNGQPVQIVVSQGSASVSWTFHGERTSGPEIASVIALGLEQVRVTFDEAPIAVSATNAGDALNPASYSVTRTPGEIAVQADIVGVTQVSATAFDLATSIELSPSMTYTLTIEDLLDALGNTTIPTSPGATAIFTAFQPAVPALRSFDLYEMIAQKNRDEDETGELRAFMSVLQDPVDLLLYEIDSFAEILDPNLAPEAFVDAMLADFADPFTFEITLSQKRLLAQLLIPIYQQKGTAPGIVDAIRLFLGISMVHVSLGFGARLDGAAILGNGGNFPGTFILGSTEGIDPFAFELLTPVALTADQLTRATAIVQFMMRGECGFLGFVVETTPPPDDPVLLGFDSVLGDGGGFPGTFILH